MNANYLAVKSKLPEHVIASLESKRGNVAELNELLEIYRKNGFTTEADNVFLMQEFMIPAEQKAARAQTDAAEERAFMEVFEKVKRKALLQQELKRLNGSFRAFLWSGICLVIALFILTSALSTEIKEAKIFADTADTLITYDDYLIEDATVVGKYAEFFQTDEKTGRYSSDEDLGYKQNLIDLYLAEVTASDGTEYLISISVDHDSDIGKKLDAIDFEENTYVLSGYFSPKAFTNYESDISNENVGMFYDEAMELYSILGYESVGKNFDYLYSADADYMSEEKDKKTTNIIMSLGIAAFGMIPLFIGIRSINKQKKIKDEIATIDAFFASKKASVTNPANLQQ